MDQTIIAQKTEEEQKLSKAIFQNLHILSVCQKSSLIATDSFRTFLKPDVFLKPNTKAFPHVYHFLLTLLDPVEFKKRIFWPCFDKNAETRFRSDVLNWLNSLNRQHSWGFDEFKMHLVVLPGGIRFMKITFELILLVMKQVIKSSHIDHEDNSVVVNIASIPKTQKNKLDAAKTFSKTVQKETNTIEEYNRSIHQHNINRINKSYCNATTKIFNSQWKYSINNLTLLNIKKRIHHTNQINEKMKIFINFVQSSYSLAEFVEFDKLTLKNCQDKLNELFNPYEVLQLSKEFEFNYNNIGKTFQNLLPNILDHIFQFSYPNNDQLQEENNLLENLYTKWQTIQMHAVNIEMNLSKRKSEYLLKIQNVNSTPSILLSETIIGRPLTEERNEFNNLNTIRFKIMETPPLSQLLLPSNLTTPTSTQQQPQRFSILFDESNVVTKLVNNNNQLPLTPLNRTLSVQTKHSSHFSKIDGQTLLNNITKHAAGSNFKIKKNSQNNRPSCPAGPSNTLANTPFLISSFINQSNQDNSFSNNNNNESLQQNHRRSSNQLSLTDLNQSSDANSSMITAFNILKITTETNSDENLFDTSDSVLKGFD